jgi:hypothetical protein
MMSNKRLYSIVGAAAFVFTGACNVDLDVTNPNNPDIVRALSSPEDVQSLAISSVNSWYLTAVGVNTAEPVNPGIYPLTTSVTTDVHTANFGNFGMRFNNLEPRLAYNNSSASNDRTVTSDPWDFYYATIGAANDVLRAIKGGLSLGSPTITEKYSHLAMFSQAASYTYIALLFDKGFVVTEDSDAAVPPTLVPYGEVATAAVGMWERLIAGTEGKSHSYAPTDLPMPDGVLTSARLNRIANTMAAMLLAYTPRNSTQQAAVNWAKVAALADKGIGTGSAGAPFDFTVIGDGVNWASFTAGYGNERTWVRVDHRVINRMNPGVPAKFDGTIPPEGTSSDARYVSDFGYVPPPIGDPARGIYMQSTFVHDRYVAHAVLSPTALETPAPFILRAESDLVRAEALLRSGGSPVTAAGLINNSRVGRGNLTLATGAEGNAALFSMISYERDIELMTTSGTALFWRRAVTDQPIQAGTWCQLPLPAKELETLRLPIYTFGAANPCS